MPRKKKQTPLQKLRSALNPTTPLKRGVMFIIAFAIIGGGYYLYKSHAYSAMPPSNLTHQAGVGAVTATDGIKAQLFCNYLTAYTGNGKMTACTQIYPGSASPWVAGRTKFRAGNYKLTTRQFFPTTGWLTYNSVMSAVVYCSNTGYYFSPSNVVLNTGYGPVSYGVMFRQVYTSSGYSWAGAFVNYSPITRGCTPAGAWFSVVPGFVY